MRYLRICVLLLVASHASAHAEGVSGSVKAGYVILDEEGNLGVNQPTFNTYEGFALSLRNFHYALADGTNFRANLENVTLNNRRLSAAVSRPGLYGLTLRSNQYRRTYDFAGAEFIRRHQTAGDLWVQPVRAVRLFGGYGLVSKKGTARELFEPDSAVNTNAVDYKQQNYHAGLRLSERQSVFEAEFRGSDYSDDLDNLNDRQTARYRVTGRTPVPRYRFIWLNAGFQHFESRLTNRSDTLTANTGWGSLRASFKGGYSTRYSLIFDRSRRTGDVVASDQIAQTISAGKTWPTHGGLTVGYTHTIHDDVFDALASDGVQASGWLNATPALSFRANAGTTRTDVEEGAALIGSRDMTRLGASATYAFKYGKFRVRAENRHREYEDLGTEADFERAGVDLTAAHTRYGELIAAYNYANGDYINTDGDFTFSDHSFSADYWSPVIHSAQVGVGGTYLRSWRDLDIERFSVHLTARYHIDPAYIAEVAYTAHNFDDFQDTIGLYTQYYTANIVEISITRELGK
jgi:hypothetical protein